MDNTTLEKLLQARGKIEPSDSSAESLTDQVMAQLPAEGTGSSAANPLSLLSMFAAMVAIAAAIGTFVAPVHQHDHRHTHQAPAPPTMDGFDSTSLLVAR